MGRKPLGERSMTAAERQQKRRQRLRARYTSPELHAAFSGKPEEAAKGIMMQLMIAQGPKGARKVVAALVTRLNAIIPECPLCHGSGFAGLSAVEGGALIIPCHCAEAIKRQEKERRYMAGEITAEELEADDPLSPEDQAMYDAVKADDKEAVGNILLAWGVSQQKAKNRLLGLGWKVNLAYLREAKQAAKDAPARR